MVCTSIGKSLPEVDYASVDKLSKKLVEASAGKHLSILFFFKEKCQPRPK